MKLRENKLIWLAGCLLMLTLNLTKAECSQLSIDDKNEPNNSKITSKLTLADTLMSSYLDAFKLINQHELITAQTPRENKQNVSKKRGSKETLFNHLKHHIFVKTETDVEKLMIQFPLTSLSQHPTVMLRDLFDQTIRLHTTTIHDELISLSLIEDSHAHYVTNTTLNNVDLLFEFDLTQQGLVQKGRIISLFFHYLNDFIRDTSSIYSADSSFPLVLSKIFSIEAMRLWHFSDDQLTSSSLKNGQVNFRIKPFNKLDLQHFTQQYNVPFFRSFFNADLIINDIGLNIWQLKSSIKHLKTPTTRIIMKGGQHEHNLRHYVQLRLLSQMINQSLSLAFERPAPGSYLKVSISENIPYALTFTSAHGLNLSLKTFIKTSKFNWHDSQLNTAKREIKQTIQDNEPEKLRHLAQLALAKSTVTDVYHWEDKALLNELDKIDLNQFKHFYDAFFQSLSIDLIVSENESRTMLNKANLALKASLTLVQRKCLSPPFERSYKPAIGTLLNKKISIAGNKNFLLDVYITPIKTQHHVKAMHILTASLQSVLADSAPWLTTRLQFINHFPAISFEVNGDIDNLKEAKHNINKLVFQIRPQMKQYLVDNFSELIIEFAHLGELSDNHTHPNEIVKYHHRSKTKPKIGPSEIMRIYDRIFLEYDIENILIQLNGWDRKTSFFIASSGNKVR